PGPAGRPETGGSASGGAWFHGHRLVRARGGAGGAGLRLHLSRSRSGAQPAPGGPQGARGGPAPRLGAAGDRGTRGVLARVGRGGAGRVQRHHRGGDRGRARWPGSPGGEAGAAGCGEGLTGPAHTSSVTVQDQPAGSRMKRRSCRETAFGAAPTGVAAATSAMVNRTTRPPSAGVTSVVSGSWPAVSNR